MLPKELLKKLRKIEIRTRRVVNETLSGQYHSVFKGRGMEFDEVRQYQPGDEIRTIDWNVTARTNDAYVKLFTEERELTVMLLVDLAGARTSAPARRPKASWPRSWRRCSRSAPSPTTTASAWSSSPTTSRCSCRPRRAASTCCA